MFISGISKIGDGLALINCNEINLEQMEQRHEAFFHKNIVSLGKLTL